MSLDKIKDLFSNLGKMDLPTGVAALAAIVLLVLVFKTGKFFTKVLFFLMALALIAGAWWWHTHK